MAAKPFRLLVPRSLSWQFGLALLAVVLLVVAAGATAIRALQANAEATQLLAGDRLARMEMAQLLVRQVLLIGRESERMAAAADADELHASHAVIIEYLQDLDRMVDDLVAASNDATILSLHQSAQLFRNNVHVSAGLREGMLSGHRSGSEEAARSHRFNDSLQWQAAAMAVAAQDVLRRYAEDYRDSVDQLAQSAGRDQGRVLILLCGSLLLAWLVSHFLLGRRIIGRLKRVSHFLRSGDTGSGPAAVPVAGDDEIAEMARAVEKFLDDRQRLAQAHRDLSAERQRQDELIGKLAQAQNQLVQSEKLAAIGQLAAGVAHEINNPIGFVQSNLGTLRRYLDTLLGVLAAFEAGEPELSPATRDTLTELKQRADLEFLREDVAALVGESIDGLQRVTRIVQDLKNFSHVDEATMMCADLEQGLDSTLNIAWNEIKYKAEIVKEYGGIPEVECIASQINQVFMNLLVNAAQAIAERGRITIRTARDGADRVRIEISDTGCGIPPENLQRIFDPFFTTKPVGKGTGLGLSLAYGIVKRHHGRIDVDSTVGVGTTFRIILPIRGSAQQAG